MWSKELPYRKYWRCIWIFLASELYQSPGTKYLKGFPKLPSGSFFYKIRVAATATGSRTLSCHLFTYSVHSGYWPWAIAWLFKATVCSINISAPNSVLSTVLDFKRTIRNRVHIVWMLAVSIRDTLSLLV